jgi:hypothetical protein
VHQLLHVACLRFFDSLAADGVFAVRVGRGAGGVSSGRLGRDLKVAVAGAAGGAAGLFGASAATRRRFPASIHRPNPTRCEGRSRQHWCRQGHPRTISNLASRVPSSGTADRSSTASYAVPPYSWSGSTRQMAVAIMVLGVPIVLVHLQAQVFPPPGCPEMPE